MRRYEDGNEHMACQDISGNNVMIISQVYFPLSVLITISLLYRVDDASIFARKNFLELEGF